jgi:pilus assembly protein CpaF
VTAQPPIVAIASAERPSEVGHSADMVRYARRNTVPMIMVPPTAVRSAEPDSSGAALQPIAPLLRDATLTEIMINGPDAIFVEREGRILLTDRRFEDENHLLTAIGALMTSAGRRLDLVDPVLEARLPDGSRLTIVLPPVAVDGPMITIRKFAASPYAIDDMIRFGSLSLEAAAFLRACPGSCQPADLRRLEQRQDHPAERISDVYPE